MTTKSTSSTERWYFKYIAAFLIASFGIGGLVLAMKVFVVKTALIPAQFPITTCYYGCRSVLPKDPQEGLTVTCLYMDTCKMPFWVVSAHYPEAL